MEFTENEIKLLKMIVLLNEEGMQLSTKQLSEKMSVPLESIEELCSSMGYADVSEMKPSDNKSNKGVVDIIVGIIEMYEKKPAVIDYEEWVSGTYYEAYNLLCDIEEGINESAADTLYEGLLKLLKCYEEFDEQVTFKEQYKALKEIIEEEFQFINI